MLLRPTRPRPDASSRRIPGLLAAVLALCLGTTLAGCNTPPRSTTPAASGTTSDLGLVQVRGEPGAKPAVEVPTPFSVRKTERRVVVAGKGPKVAQGQRVTVDYLGVNGADGREFNSSYGAKPSSFVLDPKQYLPGLVTAVVGTKVGSRVLVAIPPADAYGVEGQPSVGIGPTDTIVVVVDVKSAREVLTRASGSQITPPKGLPAVTVPERGSPRITLPKGPAPADLVVQQLVRGKGAKVRKGQQITVHYTGVIWPGGKKFDSSWDRGSPAAFPIGRGQVVGGWDEGLVGQPVGSRILLVIPPDKGYGAAGKPSFGIKGTDTLVFVVDILDAT
jgi:peptidylprolyl isomerase